MIITRRILVQVAIATGLVIAVATSMTFAMVYREAQRRDLEHLTTYVTERSRSEARALEYIQANLTLVRGQFLKRMDAEFPPAPVIERKWQERFERFPDGAWRSRRKFSDGRKWSTLWAHRNTKLTANWQTQILRAQDICDELLPGWAESFPSLYFVFEGPSNIGFDPRIPSWVWDTPADYDPTPFEWFAIALPAVPPPDRFAWTGVAEEPTSKIPFVSVFLPVFHHGVFLGSIGHDIHVDGLMDGTVRSDLPGAQHLIFRADGRLIAHPALKPEILASRGQLTMQGSGNAALKSLYAATAGINHRTSGYDSASGCFYAVCRLAGPEWYFLTTMPRAHIWRQAFASAQWVLWSGLLTLGLVVAGFATILRRQIARPLKDLAEATAKMNAGDQHARANPQRDDELGRLAVAFNEMIGRVNARDAELRSMNQNLERQVAERTSELRAALAVEHELSALKSNFISMVSHEFRTPLGVIQSAADVLDRYLDRLPEEKRRKHLDMIFRCTKNLAQLIDGVLLLGKVEDGGMRFSPAPIDLISFCQQLVDEIHSAMGCNSTIVFAADSSIHGVSSDAELLRHIFGNLLTNAVKYSETGSEVRFTISRDDEDAVFTVSDHGIGIPEDDQRNLFKSFARGRNVGQRSGTGLGLLIVKRCVELHAGSIHIASRLGEGTTATVCLPVFSPQPSLKL
jgi:signal transduction histidine kinase